MIYQSSSSAKADDPVTAGISNRIVTVGVYWLPAVAGMTSHGLGPLVLPPDAPEHRVGGALARFPGATDRAPQGLVRGFAGKEQAVAHRLHQHLAAGLAARRS